MSIIRFIAAAVVITVGLLVAAVALVLGLFAYAVQRLFGKPGRRPVFRHTVYRSRSTPPRPSRPVGDVIDVEVTDVEAIEPKPEHLQSREPR